MRKKKALVKRYEPGPAFEEVKEESMLDISPAESKEFWLLQWIKDKDLDASGFHGKELSLKLHKDGNLGSLENSSGKYYDIVSFAYQQPDATVYLSSGSETKAAGKISRRVCLVHHREHEELNKPNSGSLAPSSKKSAESSLHPKDQLATYALKRGIKEPLYCAMQQGPPFKSKVVIDGLTFESPKEYPTRREAEKAAAKLALASLPVPSSAPSIPYKGILKRLADKEHSPLPRYCTTTRISGTFISTVEVLGEIFKGEPGMSKIQAQRNAAKVACQHFEKKRESYDSSVLVLGGSDMQNAMSMPSSRQEIQSGEPGPSVPKKNDTGAGSSKETLAIKYCCSEGEQIPKHKRKREGDKKVSGMTSEGPDVPGAQSNTAMEMPQNTPQAPPKKKVKIAKQ